MRPNSAQRCNVGNTLPGLSRPLGSKAHFTRCCWFKIDLGEHHRHQVALFDADAVLAGQHAADLDAELQDVGAELFGAVELALFVGVVQNERMQVAVAGVEHVGDAEARISPTSPSCGAAPAATGRAGWCRPCSNSRARCARPPGTPPCGRPRTAAAPVPNSRRGIRRRCSRARSVRRARSDDRLPPPARRARRSAAPRRRADSRRGRILPPL